MISNFKCNCVLIVNVHTRFLISVLKISTSIDGLRSINYSAFNYVSITTAAERGWIKHEAWFPRNNTFLLWRRWLVCISYVVIRIFACFHVPIAPLWHFFYSPPLLLSPFSIPETNHVFAYAFNMKTQRNLLPRSKYEFSFQFYINSSYRLYIIIKMLFVHG